MPISQIRNLCLSSIIILCIGCAVPRKYKLTGENKSCANPLKEAAATSVHGLKYKMSIQLFKNYFTGILLYKKTDPTTFHLAFVTELGLKMFDMEIKDGELKTLYCFEPLNKPRIKGLLEKEMNLLFLTDFDRPLNKEYAAQTGEKIFISKNGREKHIYYTNANIVKALKVKKGISTKVKSKYFYTENSIPETIRLKHKGFLRLKIELNKIANE